jgi:hypothetical protein
MPNSAQGNNIYRLTTRSKAVVKSRPTINRQLLSPPGVTEYTPFAAKWLIVPFFLFSLASGLSWLLLSAYVAVNGDWYIDSIISVPPPDVWQVRISLVVAWLSVAVALVYVVWCAAMFIRTIMNPPRFHLCIFRNYWRVQIIGLFLFWAASYVAAIIYLYPYS